MIKSKAISAPVTWANLALRFVATSSEGQGSDAHHNVEERELALMPEAPVFQPAPDSIAA